MTLIGEEVAVVRSKDPTKAGVRGKVLLETMNTLLLATPKGRRTVEKSGSAFLVTRTGRVAAGEDVQGRLEDRMRARKR